MTPSVHSRYSFLFFLVFLRERRSDVYFQACCQESMTIAQTLATQLLVNLLQVCPYSEHDIVDTELRWCLEYDKSVTRNEDNNAR